MTTNNSILWTATDFTLPESLWKRLEAGGYKVLISEHDDNIGDKIKNLSPKLWAGQLNGNSEAFFKLFSDIRKNFPNLPVILMSKAPDINDAIRAIKLGAIDYLTGSVPDERLWAVLEGALNRNFMSSYPQTRRSGNEKHNTKFIADHSAMKKILEIAKKIASSRSTVLIQGESGVGKEVLARFIHDNSDRKDKPFIAVNCAALPENLLESELFGHEKGAFTGAISRKKGKFELANEGTILLDEISEMAVSTQSKLLRVLQEREIDRVGGQNVVPIDTRVIATTNRDLESETKNGNFRLDLFYRLNVVPLKIPPLRERQSDIPLLGEFLLKKHCVYNNVSMKHLSTDAEDFLKGRYWEGNVREYENLIERATLLVDSEIITAKDLESISNTDQKKDQDDVGPMGTMPLKEMEKKMIMRALDDHNGNRTHAAKVLGISVRTLRNKLNEYEETDGQ